MISNSIYVFDTSGFIGLYRDKLCQKNIDSPSWKKFDAIVEKKGITSVRAVFNELTNKNIAHEVFREDKLRAWALKKKALFAPPATEEELNLAIEIINTYEGLVSKSSIEDGLSEEADPFVIAKAEDISGIVVAQDGFRKGKMTRKVKIASVCKKRGIHCLNVKDFILREGLGKPS